MLWSRCNTGYNILNIKVIILLWVDGNIEFLELLVKSLVDRLVVSGRSGLGRRELNRVSV